ncbi:MAG: ATP-binding protein, partial [Victivallales bacterium]|nr:ATP-binding protein [Victivallales bacterium]
MQTLNLSAENLSDVHQGNFVLADAREKIAVLLSAGIWGPNASGKSNVLLALKELVGLVSTSHGYELDQPIKAFHPFLLDDGCSRKPVFFELEFIGRDGLRYIYTIEFTARAIVHETLLFYPGAKPAKLFERTQDTITFGAKLSGLRQIPYRENQCYLGVAAQHQRCRSSCSLTRRTRSSTSSGTPRRARSASSSWAASRPRSSKASY